MISAQEIRQKKFEKAVFGGYDAESVEEYMEELQTEFSLLMKENLGLKQKLKEISDRNEEYQSVETSMRKALVSAKTIASEMVEKAEVEKEKILKDTQDIAHEQINTYRKQIQDEQKLFESTKDKATIFMTQMTEFCKKQLAEFEEFQKKIPEIKSSSYTAPDLENFEIKYSEEHKEEFNLSDTGSVTATILAKIKSEAMNPKSVHTDFDDSDYDEYKDRDISTQALPILEKRNEFGQSAKFNISELKFGKDYHGE